jgi:hypothetical protein
MFKATLRCAAGHEQTITYGAGFTRHMVEDHLTLMFGGTLHSLGKEMPGMGGCAWETETVPRCEARVSFTVEEIAEA